MNLRLNILSVMFSGAISHHLAGFREEAIAGKP